jgi:NADP-dependent 3-hydroxy acid dehydrogenase YdfG
MGEPMPSDSRAVAVVTGASSGIGLEVSRLLASDRHDLVIVAQHTERLTQVAREFTTQYGVRVMADGDPDRAIASGAAKGPEGRARVFLNRSGCAGRSRPRLPEPG